MDDLKISCPKCEWVPDGYPYWQCDCGYVWNTFDTAAKCPSCKKQHVYTQCPVGCHQMSPHIDWYKDLDEWLEEIIAQINEIVEVEK